MSNKLKDLKSALNLAIAMRDPELIKSCRDNLQDYKEEEMYADSFGGDRSGFDNRTISHVA